MCDLATAYRWAIEQPVSEHVVLFIAADDSSVAEPLSELPPRLFPSIGQMARELTGSRPVLSNAWTKEVLGWRPLRSWRAAAHPA